MASMRKSAALLFILMFTFSSAETVLPAFAQPANPSSNVLPEVSAPTFSAKYIQSSYTETVTDPYTGQSSSQQKSNASIEFTIKNQPLFTPCFEASTNITTALFYGLQVKGHYEENWMPVYAPGYNNIQSNSNYTTVQWPIEIYGYPSGGQLDLRVHAIIGGYLSPPGAPEPAYLRYPLYFINETSDWSDIQTLTIGATTVPTTDTTPPPSSTPQQTIEPPQYGSQTQNILVPDWLQIALLPIVAIIVVLVVLAIIFRRERTAK